MPNTCTCAPARAYRVVVVGLKGCQYRQLNLALLGLPIDVHEVSPDKLLRKSRFDCLVVLTRFTGHKHSIHAEKIAPEVIRLDRGSAQAVAEEILKKFDLLAT